MEKELFFVEIGLLLKKGDEWFDYYNIENFYQNEYGFYDYNRLTFFDYNKARKYVEKWLEEETENHYAFIHNGLFDIIDEQEQEINDCAYCEYSLDNPQPQDVIYFARKEKDKIIIEIDRAIMEVENGN